MGMIGETFDDGDEICGAVLAVRRIHDRIALWTKNGGHKEVQQRVGKQFKEILGVSSDITIGYSMHDEALKTNSRYVTFVMG